MNAGDSYTTFQRTAVLVSSVLGLGLDLYNLLIMAFLLTSIERAFHVTLLAAGLITSTQLLTSVLGGIAFGWIGDIVGRRTTLVITVLVFGVGALLSAMSWSFGSLVVFRAIAGLGLGGEVGAGMVLLNEVWPPSRRGLGSCIVQAASPAFSVVAAVVATALLVRGGPDAWRLILLTGAFPIVLAVAVRFVIPESHVWLSYMRLRKAGHLPTVKQHAPSALLAILKGRALYLVVLGVLVVGGYMFAYYGLDTFLPTLLARTYRAPHPAIGEMIEVGSAVTVAACVLVGLIGDRWGKKTGFLIPTLVSVIGSAGFFAAGRSPSAVYAGSFWAWSLVWWYIVWHVGQSSLGMIGAWFSELFPVEMRNTAVSAVYTVGRAAGAAAPPAVALVAATHQGDLLLGIGVALTGVLVQLALLFLLPATRATEFTIVSEVGGSVA